MVWEGGKTLADTDAALDEAEIGYHRMAREISLISRNAMNRGMCESSASSAHNPLDSPRKSASSVN